MPSYIELDKNASIPSASSDSKIILGVNTNGVITIKNNAGDNLPIGAGLVEITRNEIQTLVENSQLMVGTYYQISGAASRSFLDANGFGYYHWGNEIQEGGTTIILQATSENTLSKSGVGLFYVPNYEDPNNPTTPPDYNYMTWDDTHRLYFNNLSGKFDEGEYILIYSNDTDTSTYGYIVGTTGDGAMTIYLENSNDNFFSNSQNRQNLNITGQWDGATCDINGYDYVTTYAVDDKVIWGNRVWKNLTGNIGERSGDWTTQNFGLNSEDWEIVGFNNTDYTLVADIIEYEFEWDNISFRNDGRNEVKSDWFFISNNTGDNGIKGFPWGHKNITNIKFQNTYGHTFVNYHWDSEAWNISFDTWGEFNANRWGRGMYIYSIKGGVGSSFYGHTFSNGAYLEEITLDTYADMYDITTYDNDYGNYTQLYNIHIGQDGSFGSCTLCRNSYIERINIGQDSWIQYFTMLDYSRIYNVSIGVDGYMGWFDLYESAEIKTISIGNYSYITNFTLYYSSCLKRITLATESYINSFNVGIQSFIRQVNLSDRAYFNSFSVGEYSNLQNIDLGAYAYFYQVNVSDSSNVQNIRLDAKSHIESFLLGDNSTAENIELSPNSYIYNIDGSGYTNQLMRSITIKPGSYIEDITFENSTNFSYIYVGNNAIFGLLGLQENAVVNDIHLMGDTSCGEMTFETNSTFKFINVELNAGFGGMTVASGIQIEGIRIENGEGFGGKTFNTNIYDRTIGKSKNTLYIDTPIDMVLYGDYNDVTALPYISLDGKSIIYVDVSGTIDSVYAWRIPDGDFEGQEITFVVTTDGSHLVQPDNMNFWSDKLIATGAGYSLSIANSNAYLAVRPFVDLNSNWKNMTKMVWMGNRWYSDSTMYND